MSRKLTKPALLIVILFFAGFLFSHVTNAQEILGLEPLQFPSTVEGTGTHFEITNSSYLNVTLDSTEAIKLRMESIPEMVTMFIEPVDYTTISTQITIQNFQPNTTYYKYEDDYHNLTTFTADLTGSYSYTQDLSQPHFAFIQTQASTKFVKDDTTGGDCSSIGIWDLLTKTCTLTTNVYETIQIDSNGITLDGNGYTIIGTGAGYYRYSSVYLSSRTGVTIKNLNVTKFTVGIHLSDSSNNTLIGNTVYDNSSGIRLIRASSAWYSSNNTLIGNTVSNNSYGIEINSSSDSTFRDNTVRNNSYGIYLTSSARNTFTNNTVSNNSYGVYFQYTNNIQTFYNNNFQNNTIQAKVSGGSGNVFNLAAPIGGNYWSDYDTLVEGCSDANSDSFCDSPYVFTGGQDNLPWVRQDGWSIPQNQPPTLSDANQYKSDSVTQIPEGGITTEDTVIFKAALTDPDNDRVKLEVELKSFSQTFDGQSTTSTPFAASGNTASITVSDLTEGQYHWRARAVDDQGNTSDWQEFGTPGNVDFEVKLVPLYTQVRSPYPSDDETKIWAVLDYGDGYYLDCLTKKNPNDPSDPTMYSNIARCGCAITSMVMLGRYYEIATSTSNNSIDPATINTWLTSNSGYTDDGRLYWGKAIEYLGYIDQATGKKMARLSLDYFNATSTLPIIDNYITSAKPAVAYSSKFGHYFVVDDKLQNTYTLKDPRWYNTKKLNDLENLANEVRGYDNNFDTANLFSYLETPQQIAASMYLYLASPAEFLITDPLGRKLGEDPSTNTSYNEIPDGSYTQEGPIITSDTPLDQGQIHKTKVIYIPTPIDGNYDIRVIGTDTGSYKLNAFTYDNQGESHSQIQTGNTQTDLNIGYNLNFTPDAPENITIQPQDTELPVISHTQLNSEYILNSAPIAFNFSAQDAGIGVYKISATLDGNPIPSGQSVLFEQLGSHEIKITAEDFVGNTAIETINFDVIYNFSGFLSPIKIDGSGVYKLDRTLPVKFQLTDANGNYISTAINKLYVAKISDGVVGMDEIPLSTSNADTGNIFRYDLENNQYIYNLAANGLSVGSWQLKIILDDGKYYTVIISIK